MDLNTMGQAARQAARQMAQAADADRRRALEALAAGLSEQQGAILEANHQDVAAARAAGLTPALVDRLTLTPARLQGMAADVRTVAALPDPLGTRFDERTLPNGLRVRRQRVPIGVLGVIYESRPNVTVDVAALAIRTGNVAILRGGSETIRSNCALAGALQRGLEGGAIPAGAIQLVADTDRQLVYELLQMDRYVDMPLS